MNISLNSESYKENRGVGLAVWIRGGRTVPDQGKFFDEKQDLVAKYRGVPITYDGSCLLGLKSVGWRRFFFGTFAHLIHGLRRGREFEFVVGIQQNWCACVIH